MRLQALAGAVRELKSLVEQIDKEAALFNAVDDYIEIAELGGVTAKNRREVVRFLAQKWGISPIELEKQIEKEDVAHAEKIEDFRELVKKAWDLVLERLPAPIAELGRRMKLEIREVAPDDPDAEAETFPDVRPTGFRVFRKGFTKAHGRDLTRYMLVIAHELYHAFSDRYRIYEKLRKILSGKLESWLGIGRAEAEDLMKYLELLTIPEIEPEFLKTLKRKLSFHWGEEYVLDQAEWDRLNGILRFIQRPEFRGIFDEAMAEAMARLVTGKSLWFPARMLSFILEIGRVPEVVHAHLERRRKLR